MAYRFDGTSHGARGSYELAGSPLVFHCHHYNLALQMMVEDVFPDGGVAQQVQAAEEEAHTMLKGVAAANPECADFQARLSLATSLHAALGFGVLQAQGTPTGGSAGGRHLHYAYGHSAKSMLQRDQPLCHFHAGFLAAAFAVAAGKPPGSYSVKETSCMAMGADACHFEVAAATGEQRRESVGPGQIITTDPPPMDNTGNIRAAEVLAALATLPLIGNEEGLIPAFGVYLTRHLANYYNRISYDAEAAVKHEVEAVRQGVRVGLIEAGHICAFHTFGGIALSPEWQGLVQPMCRDKSDWFHGLVTVANALGWGSWRAKELIPGKRAVVDVYGTYESNGQLAMYGKQDHACCYLHTGAVAGFMNLLWVGDVTEGPTLDAAYYNRIYSAPESFVGEEIKCRSKGDEFCTFVAERRSF